VNHLIPTNTKLDVTTIQNGLTSLYQIHNYISSNPQGASSALTPGPPSRRGTPPAPGPSGPRGNYPVIVALAIVALRIKVRDSAGSPIHCSRIPSSRIHTHILSGIPSITASSRRWKSSNSPPTSVGGACDGPTPGSS
jgi:hypothetical protein